MRFFDQYRSYVINYNLGKDLVKQYVDRERRGGAGAALAGVRPAARLARLPSGLRATALSR